MYVLYDENIDESDISAAETCLREFQLRIVDIFGESVKTITLHALRHLPEQVRKFGPLHAVSAMPFENLNRQIKQSVTGTRGTAAIMVYRYLNFQSFLEKSDPALTPTVLGKSIPYKRFKNGSLVFHTHKYGKSLMCASYFAFLANANMFVKIKRINIVTDDYFTVVCRSYISSTLTSGENSILTKEAHKALINKSPFKILLKGDIKTFCPTEFTHHALIVQYAGYIHAVKILNTFEHD